MYFFFPLSSSFLEEDDECQENLLNHFHSDFLNTTKEFARTKRGFGSTKSVVLLEESGLKAEQMFKKFSQNTNQFLWEKNQSASLGKCPDMECLALKDPDNDENVGPKPSIGLKKKPKLMHGNIGWYGICHEDPNNSLKITPKLKLCRIFNILWLLPHNYLGLHTSYLYLGTKHSFFPIHVEDANLLSINYLHFGHPKVW